MATVELTKENFDEVVGGSDGSGIVLVDFWAEWCGPCRAFGPTYEAASDKNEDIVFGKFDTEAQQELAATFGIRSIPTLMIVREGVVLFSQPGALPGPALDGLIQQAREVNVEEVHAKVAEAQAQQG
jgi:thioredoxin 1